MPSIAYIDSILNVDKYVPALYNLPIDLQGLPRLMTNVPQITLVPGLESVVAAETRLSSVEGKAGELIIAGFPVKELAGRATFEETIYLLWHDVLPGQGQLMAFREALSVRRPLPRATLDLLRAAASKRGPVMDALRMAA